MADNPQSFPLKRRRKWTREIGDWFVNLPPVRNRVPLRYRPALYLDSAYNVGTGAFICLFLLSAVVLKTVVGGTETHLAVLAALLDWKSVVEGNRVDIGGRRCIKKT